MLKELFPVLILLGVAFVAGMVRAQVPPEIDLCKEQLARAHVVYDEMERRSVTSLADQQKSLADQQGRLAWWADCAASQVCWEWVRHPANG